MLTKINNRLSNILRKLVFPWFCYGFLLCVCVCVCVCVCFGHTPWLAGSHFPDQGLNPSPWQYKCRILITGLPGNSSVVGFFVFVLIFLIYLWLVTLPLL